MLEASVMKVMGFHNVAGEFQLIFASKLKFSKDFFDILYDFLIEICQKFTSFY